MKAFDPRHFAAFLGAFEAINQHDRAAIDTQQAATERMLEALPPQLG